MFFTLFVKTKEHCDTVGLVCGSRTGSGSRKVKKGPYSNIGNYGERIIKEGNYK